MTSQFVRPRGIAVGFLLAIAALAMLVSAPPTQASSAAGASNAKQKTARIATCNPGEG